MMLNDLQNFPTKSSWAKSVKSLLDNLGFGHVWIEQGVGNINMFLRIFKERLTDNFVQGWDDEVHNSSRANTYKLISNFSFRDYLDFVTVRKFRYAFTRLRVASHRLEIETGRIQSKKENAFFVIVWKMNFTLFWNANYIKIYGTNI